MVTIVSALKGELQPFLERWKVVKKKSIAKGTLHITDKSLHFLRCGVGGVLCSAVLDAYLKEYHPDTIINIGTAGIVNPLLMQTEIFEIGDIYHPRGECIGISTNEHTFVTANLLTVDKPLMDKELRDQYFDSLAVDLVDMESWYCAKKAESYQIKFRCYKISSDSADENSEKDFLQNYKKLAKKLAVAVNPIIKGILKDE